MPTVDQIRALRCAGHSFESIARELEISPGLAYIISTGLPADRSSQPPSADAPPGQVLTSPQLLVNPTAFNPLRKQHVIDWVKQRTDRELSGSDG